VAINYRRNRRAAEQTLAELTRDGHVMLLGVFVSLLAQESQP
jgi:hypothetical protein